MAWNKAYTRIVWQNSPITDTPLNATNLNKMDAALNEIDNRVLLLEGSAFVHIKYSDYPNPTNIQMKDTPSAYMGICVTSEETAPTQASAYTWNRVRGEEVQLQVADEHIQWKYAADATWTNLIPLDSLKGEKGDKGDQGLPGVYYGEEEPDPALYQVWVNPSEDGKIVDISSAINNHNSDDDAHSALFSAKLDKSGGTMTGMLTLHDDPSQPMHAATKQYVDSKTSIFNVTLDTSWLGSAAPYSKSVTVTGILETDTPIIDVVMSGTYATDEARQEAWGYVYRAVTADNSITFYANEKPSVELPVQIKVVR